MTDYQRRKAAKRLCGIVHRGTGGETSMVKDWSDDKIWRALGKRERQGWLALADSGNFTLRAVP